MITDNKFIFSDPRIIVVFMNNYGKIIIILFFTILAYSLINNNLAFEYSILYLYILTPIIIFIIGISYFIKKFAYKIIIDYNLKEITLYMYRNKKILKKNFQDLYNVKVNGYIIFYFDKEKVFHKQSNNKDFLTCIKRITNIEWGILCFLFGPDKSLRKEIDNSHI